MTESITKLLFDSSSDSEEEFALLLKKLTVSGKKKNCVKSHRLKFDGDENKVSSSSSENNFTTPLKQEIHQNKGKKLPENIQFPMKPESASQNCEIKIDKPDVPASCPRNCKFASDDEETFITPVTPVKKLECTPQLHRSEGSQTYATPTHRWMDIATVPCQGQIDLHAQFLESLSTGQPSTTPSLQRLVSGFPSNRQELSAHLYRLFNQIVFSDQLPKDMLIVWNSRLTSCAGRCFLQTDKTTKVKCAHIELSTKVIGNAAQTRDTTIHEMCHAATWIINEVRESHGYYWKYWATRTRKIFPSMPPITRCHNYK